jgi:hypothetical protein
MLAYGKEVDAESIGQDRLLDNLLDHARLRNERAIGVNGDVAEGIETKFELLARLSHASSIVTGADSSFGIFKKPHGGQDSAGRGA